MAVDGDGCVRANCLAGTADDTPFYVWLHSSGAIESKVMRPLNYAGGTLFDAQPTSFA